MTDIINTTQLQQKAGQITASLGNKAYIVTQRGTAKGVMLPYFSGCIERIEDYLEDYEMWLNRDKLEKELQESIDSGESDHRI